MKLFATIIALAGVFTASAQAHQETNISKWQFSQTGTEWKAVTVPHDWAISGPFDKKWDLQICHQGKWRRQTHRALWPLRLAPMDW